MTLRIRTVSELPQSIRESVAQRLRDCSAAPTTPSRAASALRQLQFREQRERLALAMLKQLEYLNLASLFVREFKFHPQRKWRLDLYASAYQFGIELHGGIFSGGRHTRGSGFRDDREKMNAAVELGISVLEYWPQAIADGSAAAQVERIIAARQS